MNTHSLPQLQQTRWHFTRLTTFIPSLKTIKGAMSPMLTAKQVAAHMEEQLLSVWRVRFITSDGSHNPRMYQVYEPGEGYTGWDLLLIALENTFCFFVDRSSQPEPLGTSFYVLPAECDVIPPVRPYAEELTHEQMLELLN